MHVTGGVGQGVNTLLLRFWSYNISSITEGRKRVLVRIGVFLSIRWVDIKAYLSYKDTVKTDFEIRGILAQYVAIITPLATYYAENGC